LDRPPHFDADHAGTLESCTPKNRS
jgi:hypothetical protein